MHHDCYLTSVSHSTLGAALKLNDINSHFVNKKHISIAQRIILNTGWKLP